MPNLLIELFSEEIPARMQARAAEDLRRLVTGGLVDRGLTYADAMAFATPRRLTLALGDLPAMTRAVREERKGPRTDAPEAAIEGFLRSAGVERAALERRADRKGEVYFAVMTRPGRPAAEVVAEVLEGVIRTFPWPKSMRWGAGSLRWVRPLQSILCLLSDEAGAQVVPLRIDGIAAGATTEGHRFMSPGRFAVTGFEDYASRLGAAHVVLDPAERQARIWHEATQLAFARGWELVEDKGLLVEVAGLVEWPVPLLGEIPARFLDLPPEVLRTSMKAHQKFFSVRNPATGRIEGFVTVANRETADGGATVLAGNIKVLAARLSDAAFFWENDLRVVRDGGMAALAAPLASVTFHNRLGTQAARVERIAALAREIAPAVGADPDEAEAAARVVKADLTSAMVGEFPELQGVMGRYYAKAAGLSDAMAAACAEHYAPVGPSDAVPTAPVSVAVALADKIDMLAGFWAIGEKPTGSGDPYALRRAALGVVRTVLEGGLRVKLADVFPSAFRRNYADSLIAFIDDVAMFSSDDPAFRRPLLHTTESWKSDELMDFLASSIDSDDLTKVERRTFLEKLRQEVISGSRAKSGELIDFFADRLKVLLRTDGIRHDVIDACFQLGGQDDLVLLVNRVRALQAFLGTEDGANLVQGYRRAVNILTAEEKKDGVSYELDPDVKFAEGEVERALFAALDGAEGATSGAVEREDFAGAMVALATLRTPIDAFFDAVQVNSANGIVRRNRLCLLNRIRAVMHRVAVFSALEG